MTDSNRENHQASLSSNQNVEKLLRDVAADAQLVGYRSPAQNALLAGADELKRMKQELWVIAECIFRNVSSDDAKHWARDIKVSLQSGDQAPRVTVETSKPQYRKWPGEPPHCMSCDCGMTEEQKALAARTVPLEDYLSVHRELMNLKYPGSSQVEPRETTDDMQVLRGIVNNQAADREFLTVSMALLRRIVRAQEPTYNPETVASIKAAQASGGNAVCCQRFPNCECIPPKAQVKAGDPCPTFDTAVHEAHNGKCMYCGAPIAPVKAAEPQALTEAEQLLQAWADLLPPNGNLYWVHIEKARDYFKRRSAKETSAPLPPEVLANALQDVVHVDDGPVRAGRSVKATDEVRATYNATVDDLNEEQCASIGHEFRPIDSSGQVVCIFCNRRPENGKGNP